MTAKAYIVANEQQEREVLEKLEREGFTWWGGDNLTENMPSNRFKISIFPYIIFTRYDKQLTYDYNVKESYLPAYEIVYDGRKEDNMSEKYVMSQEFMGELEDWKEAYITDTLDEKYHYVSAGDLDQLPGMIKDWWIKLNKPTETNNRLIAILRWVNGEDVFDVEKPKKWVVRSKGTDNDGDYRYVSVFDSYFGITYADSGKDKLEKATHFDTKEEAESWANSHQEVIEVEA